MAEHPGPQLAANYRDQCEIAAGPQPLNRVRRLQRHGELDPAGTLYADRRNNLDFRVADPRFGRTDSVGLDIYNVTNTDVVTSYNQAFSPTSTTWLTPTGIQPARYVKVSGQFDF